VTGVHAPTWWEWSALALGMGIGMLLAHDGVRSSPAT
jgi:hypothetical protein